MVTRRRIVICVSVIALALCLASGTGGTKAYAEMSDGDEEPEFGDAPQQLEPPANPPASKRSQQANPNAGGPSEAELKLRMMLMQRSMGFGGIFGPLIAPLNQGGGSSKQNECGHYTDYAACQAYKAGDGWAADRLQNHRSTPSERDWYNR
jgi:hypothetical protein